LNDKKEGEAATTANEEEGDDNNYEKMDSPSEQPIIDDNTKTAIERERRGQENNKEQPQPQEPAKKVSKPSWSPLSSAFGMFGPGVITGASDDDPSGIATYSQAGAQFGFGLLWMVPFLYPLMTAVQEMCARIGLVTGNGLAGVLKKKYSKKII
jgi:hypothetical protein